MVRIRGSVSYTKISGFGSRTSEYTVIAIAVCVLPIHVMRHAFFGLVVHAVLVVLACLAMLAYSESKRASRVYHTLLQALHGG